MREGSYDLTIVVERAPQTGDERARKFWETLKKWSLDIFTLDANAHVCGQEGCTGTDDEAEVNENGELMMDWLQGARLHAVNTLEDLGPTFYGPGGSTRIDDIVTSKGQWSEVQAWHDLEAHHVLKRSQAKNPWDHVPVRAKIHYEFKAGADADGPDGLGRAMGGTLRDVEQRKTFVQQTEKWVRIGENRSGGDLQEWRRGAWLEPTAGRSGRNSYQMLQERKRAKEGIHLRQNVESDQIQSNVGIRKCDTHIKQRCKRPLQQAGEDDSKIGKKTTRDKETKS